MLKKALCAVLAAAMLFSTAACSSGSKTSSNAAQGADGSSGTPKKVEIDFWYGLGGKLGDTMKSVINEFNKSQDEVVVNGVQQADYEETRNKIQAAAAADQVPATALMTWQILRQFSTKGVLSILDDYIAKDSDFNRDDIIQSFMSYCVNDDGKVMGLPVYGTTQVVYYRKDAFQKAGINPDDAFKTWNSLAEASAKMAVKSNGKTTFYGFEPMSGRDCLEDMAFSNGGSIVSEDGKTVTIASPEWVESWESARKWIHDDKIMGIHTGGNGWEYWYKTIDDVMQNRAGGYVGSSGDQGDLDFSIVAAHIQPGFGKNSPKPYADAITCGLFAKASDEQKEAGFKWLTYLTSGKVGGMFSMNTGYIPTRKSCTEDPTFKKYLEDHPQALVPIKQAEIARKRYVDPTGGKIDQAIVDAADLVEIENVPAKQALEQQQKIAQAALDEYWASKG